MKKTYRGDERMIGVELLDRQRFCKSATNKSASIRYAVCPDRIWGSTVAEVKEQVVEAILKQ